MKMQINGFSMYNYDSLRDHYATKVCQTIDEPILIFDHFNLSELFAFILNILFVGVLFDLWLITFLSSIFILGFAPIIRKRSNKGVYLHYPYRHFGFVLPGIINPLGRKKFSD